MHATPAPAPQARRRGLTTIIVVVVLALAGLTAAGTALYRELYSPAAFVERYLHLLAEHRAADALRVPGVALSREQLAALDLAHAPSDALLRQDALGTLSDINASQVSQSDDVYAVQAYYRAEGKAGQMSFRVVQDGWIGVVPRWRFAESPLAVLNVVVRGSDQLAVNGFSFDRRQVAADGVESAPLTPVPMLVFAPGSYTVSVDTQLSSAEGVTIRADAAQVVTQVDVQTQPSDELVAIVQERVDAFLQECAAQRVLQPTACPFGFHVDNRIVTEPAWEIARYPAVALAPSGAGWQIPATDASAHLTVRVQSIFDGTVSTLSEDVPFAIKGTVTTLPDGTLSVRVSSP